MKMKLKDGKSKALTLSYDDGVVQDMKLIEIMDKYGLKGTFNINTGLYLDEYIQREKNYGRMKLSEAKKLYTNSGHEVAVHTLYHPSLVEKEDADILKEVLYDRENIEKQYGTLARGMAYPYGTYNDNVVRLLKECGIAYSRTTKTTENFNFPENWLLWHPTCHHYNSKLIELAKRFVNDTDENAIFYLWGHSYEFDNNDNWNVIEEFAEYVGRREEIWYATNIEIYDYVEAYKNLQMSIDKRIIYNPSSIDVWFEKNNRIYNIRSGEKLFI